MSGIMRNILPASLVLLLVACATPMPTLEFTPGDITPVSKKLDADLRSITVSVALEQERLGETQVGLSGNFYEQGFKASLKTALEEGLARSAVFDDLSRRKISLDRKSTRLNSSHGS